MEIKTCNQINRLLTQEKWGEASSLVLASIGKTGTAKTPSQALSICRNLFQFLLDNEMYAHAAALQWGPEMFSAEPESVQRIFKALHEGSKILFCGASSMGKSYSAGVWMYLDWRRDPIYTSVKCVGVSEDQVRKHVFAHIVKLHRSCAIPATEDIIVRDADMWMGVKSAGNEFGITAIAYKQSQETSGGIKGYKSMPVRIKPHPKFGYFSRLRLLGDEGQNWPNGPFKDIQTWVSQIDGAEKVKIAIAFNPETVGRLIVDMAQPEHGWMLDDVESLYDYESKSGWRVCRLDAARSENVIQKKKIYEGLQTYEGYTGYLKSGGDSSPDYFCFARGFPPMKSSVNTIIPPTWPQEARGEATFIEVPTTCAAVDLAFMGKDTAQMAVGRWGLASGWRDEKGKDHIFKDRLNITKDKPRHVLQIDQILPLAKHDDTTKMAEEIIGRAKMLLIKPEWVAVDKMQPVTERVLTPSGFVKIGTISIGDKVIGSNGKPIIVTGIYPQVDRRVVRVSFTDGSSTRCGPEHLWSAARNGVKIPRSVTTKLIQDDMKASGSSWAIPMLSSPAEFSGEYKIKVDPYLLGLLLGDGNMTDHGIRFSTLDKELIDYISVNLPAGVSIKHSDRCNYAITNDRQIVDSSGRFVRGNNPLLNELQDMDVYGKRSENKEIPFEYLVAKSEDRIALLQGLMDTDGFVQNSGSGIRLSSKKMIMQIKHLVETLGGSARYSTGESYCNGKRCLDWHKLTIALPESIKPFRLDRKLSKLKKRKYPINHRIIKSIIQEDDEDSVCIRVDSEDHLYVTENCILTHNTGYGFGTWSHLTKVWGDVFGISWNEKSTEKKILAEDQDGADKQVEGVMSEMWWAFRRWLDPTCAAVLINPIIPPQPIQTQLTSRRYKHAKNGIKVEPKEEYVSRNRGISPDESDALVMLVHCVRKNTDVIPGLVEQQAAPPDNGAHRSEIKFMKATDMSDMGEDHAEEFFESAPNAET